ncbi:hypothetical protein GPK34_06840 [Secundilactobacillus kimchicus]|uniref:phage tail protein n=1 Tax=Secundilactobacillus kimchicus TaxID=528209 RepID=UPI001C025AE2|nr:phage tail protein [Secundilactobacillus kimchicus]MBT9671745.1 hypothetical protein [Secundilactobacillus kimchicus]
MSKYNDTILTTVGNQYAEQAANGGFSFKITRAESTADDMSGLSEDDLRTLKKLPNPVQEGSIVGADDRGKGLKGTAVTWLNTGLEKSYTINAVALYAKADGSEDEVLYAVATAKDGHGQYMPDFKDKVTLQFGLTIVVIVGNTDNVTVQFDPAGLATIKFVEDAIAGIDLSKYVLKDDLETLLPKGIVSLSDDNQHVTATTKDGEQTGVFVTPAMLDALNKKIDDAKQAAIDQSKADQLAELDARGYAKHVWRGTQADFDKITTKDPDTDYYIFREA